MNLSSGDCLTGPAWHLFPLLIICESKGNHRFNGPIMQLAFIICQCARARYIFDSFTARYQHSFISYPLTAALTVNWLVLRLQSSLKEMRNWNLSLGDLCHGGFPLAVCWGNPFPGRDWFVHLSQGCNSSRAGWWPNRPRRFWLTKVFRNSKPS